MAEAPTGTVVPRCCEPLAGSATKLMLFATVCAFSVDPSVQVTPSRMVKDAEVGVSSHFSANHGLNSLVSGSISPSTLYCY